MGILSTGIAQNLNSILAKMGEDQWQSAYDDLEGIMKKKKNNIDLGQRRYKEVYDYLVEKGVAPGQLKTGTYGEQTPTQNNSTRQGRALNRRVMLSFID